MWHALITLPCALRTPASVARSDQSRIVTRASTYSANRPPVPVPYPVPVWSEPLVRLLTADAGRLRDQLECDDMCHITCLAQWTSTRTPLARWAADRSMLSLQRHLDAAVYRHWLQVSTLRRGYADAVDWLQVLPALAIAGVLSDGNGSSSSSSSSSSSASATSSGRWNLRQIGYRCFSAGKRSASLLRGFWPRRQPSQPPAAAYSAPSYYEYEYTAPSYTVPQLASAIEPLHAEIKSAVAVTLRSSPLVVLGLGLQLLTFLLVSHVGHVYHVGAKLHAQRMLPRLLDDAATALESSRLAETRRLVAIPGRSGGPPPAAAEPPTLTFARRLPADTPAVAAQWIGALQFISSD